MQLVNLIKQEWSAEEKPKKEKIRDFFLQTYLEEFDILKRDCLIFEILNWVPKIYTIIKEIKQVSKLCISIQQYKNRNQIKKKEKGDITDVDLAEVLRKSLFDEEKVVTEEDCRTAWAMREI